MDYPFFTDEQLDAFRKIPKYVKDPQTGLEAKQTRGHMQSTCELTIKKNDESISFKLFGRVNSKLPDRSFSCGIILMLPDNKSLMLARYNGKHVSHGRLRQDYHIHRTREEELRLNINPEKNVESAKGRYTNFEGALHCLATDYNVSGLSTQPDGNRLI